MGTITLDDGRSFTVDDSFGKLPADQQQKIVGELKKQLASGVASEIKSQPIASGTAPVASSAEAMLNPPDMKARGEFLPIGKTNEGKLVPAVPGIVSDTYNAIKGFIGAGSLGTGKDADAAAIGPAAELATTFAPISPAAKEGAAVVRGLIGGKAPETLTTDELHAAGSAAYKQAEQSGVVIKPDAFRGMVSDIAKEVKEAGFDKDIQQESAAALRRLANEAAARKPVPDAMQALTKTKTPEAAPVSLSDFDTMSQVVGAASASIKPNDRRIAGIIKGHMNDFLANLTEDQVVGGNTAQGVSALKDARQIWARYSKSSEIDTLFENALTDAGNYSAAGYENALRNQFKTLSKSAKRMQKYSADEREAIKAVARGSNLQKAMTKLGKFSPTSGFFGGVLAGDIALKAATNPALLAVPGVGAVSKYIAARMRTASAEKVRALVSGGKEAAKFFKERKVSRKNALSDAFRKGQRPTAVGLSGLLNQGQSNGLSD